jgi:chromosome segregation ATPase
VPSETTSDKPEEVIVPPEETVVPSETTSDKPEEVIVPSETTSDKPEEVIVPPEETVGEKYGEAEFLAKVNETPLKVGHNKWQLRVFELQDAQHEMKKLLEEKDMKNALYKQTINNLQNEIKSLGEEIIKLNGDNSVDELSSQLSELQNEKKEDRAMIAFLRANIQQLNTTCDEFKSNIQKLSIEVREKNSAIQNLDQTLANVKFRLDEVVQNENYLNDTVRTLENQLRVARSDISDTEKENKQLRQRVAELTSSGDELANMLENTKAKLLENDLLLQQQVNEGVHLEDSCNEQVVQGSVRQTRTYGRRKR